jgi:hypothetical protein
MRARFESALAGRLVMVLVAMAVATAWYGQERFLRESLGLGSLFAAAGATALEVFGLSMFGIARDLGKFRDRALRVRVFGWAVIAFSASSNLVHNGVALAAMSVVGPVAWELYEWSRHRIRLHHEGKLTIRPVRPRFPIDQVLLYPLWTFAAYRVAVRDRIEEVDTALAIAARERSAQPVIDRSTRRSWIAIVRQSIAAHHRSTVDRARQSIEDADRSRAHFDQARVDLKQQADLLTDLIDRSGERGTGERVGTTGAAGSRDNEDRSRCFRGSRRRIRRADRSADTPSQPQSSRAIDREVTEADAMAPTGQINNVRSVAPRSTTQFDGAVDVDTPATAASTAGRSDTAPTARSAGADAESEQLVGRGGDRPARRATPTRPFDELVSIGWHLIEIEGWSPQEINVSYLMKRLGTGPVRARQLRDMYQHVVAADTATAEKDRDDPEDLPTPE